MLPLARVGALEDPGRKQLPDLHSPIDMWMRKMHGSTHRSVFPAFVWSDSVSASVSSRAHTKLKLFFYIFSFIIGCLLLGMVIVLVDVSNLKERGIAWFQLETEQPRIPQSIFYLNSTPTMRFRDNLVDGVRYVTAWPIEGFTNQYMSQINLIYLSGLAGRIPVLPSFVPSHMKGKPNPGPLPFSEVFDLHKLASVLQRPILEWKDVKNTSSREVEDIGCWSTFKQLFGNEPHFRSEEDLALDVSLTKVPDFSSFSPGKLIALNIMALASLGWGDTRANALKHTEPSPSPQHKHITEPDETMLCYDNLYYVGAARDYEWERAWSPSWNSVGRHAKYNPRIERVAREYVSRAFGVSAADPFPSYISVHARHTDFIKGCQGRPAEHCFPPLSIYAAMVEQVRTDIMSMHGINVENVLLTSDEGNQTWWDQVHELGWKFLDHKTEQTEKIHGAWYPVLLDTVALSLAKGFVGTKGSTLSLVASKRVESWEEGAVRDVALGDY